MELTDTNRVSHEEVKRKRLDSLDGLRGIAILLVFLNHIDSQFIVGSFPLFIRPVIETFFTSGLSIGVGFLFILSGFLMSYIYPHPKNGLDFLQKRYTRIFPLFISMTLVMAIFRIVPSLDPVSRILYMVVFAIATHLFWVYGIQKLNKPSVSRLLFLGFIAFQLFAGLLYAVVIMRQPAIVFNQLLPAHIREGIITLVNITLTLPLGRYIPMLNGVYWTLACEVLFYILYPTICVPFVSLLAQKSRLVKILFLISLLPFFSALTDISKRLLGLSMLNFPFFMYFATGISLGYLAKHREDMLRLAISQLKYVSNVASFIVLIVVAHILLNATSGQLNDWVVMMLAFPLTLFVAFVLDSSTSISTFFSSKYLVLLGIISYSIYLSHTGIVDTAHLIFRPYSVVDSILFIVTVFAATVSISYILHNLLEKPYFSKRTGVIRTQRSSIILPFPVIAFGIILFFMIAIFLAFQSNFNLLSYEKSFGIETIISPHVSNTTEKISIKDSREIIFKIKSPENKFGIITANLAYEFDPQKGTDSGGSPQLLIFQIKPSSSSQWYATSTYKPGEIGQSKMHPFGFPVFEQSKDQSFDVKLSLSNNTSPQNIYLNIKDGVAIRTVNQINKEEIIRNPDKLFSLIVQRVETMSSNIALKFVLLKIAPFMIFVVYLSIRRKNTENN